MISERIYSIRTERHMSQEAVAEKLGVSRQSIQKWEAGDSQPTVQNLITLSRLFGVSVERVMRFCTVGCESHYPFKTVRSKR